MRPIDADAMKDWIDCGHLRSPIELCYSELDVLKMLDKQPTIESEPVVHCKDCKYSKKFNITGNRYCEFHGAYEYPVSDDDYCSRGAKMDLEG